MQIKFSWTISLLFIFSLIPYEGTSQNAFSASAGARGIGLGNANLAFQDIYSGFNNQAGLAHLDNFSAATFIENRFLLKELQIAAFNFAKPTKSGTWGLAMQYFGFSDYNEQKIGLNYSRILFDKLAIGGQFDFLNTRINEYGSAAAITFELGLQYQILDNLIMGIHIFNPVRAKIGTNSLPSIIQIGLSYQAGKYINISGSIEKNTSLPYNIRFGLEYNLQEKIQIRAGVNSNPNRLSFGIGYQINRIQLNVATSYHDVLGFSPAFGLSFSPSKSK